MMKLAPKNASILEKATIQYLKETFVLDEETGILRWNRRPESHFSEDRHWKGWNKKYAGTEAGAIRADGRKHVHIFGILVLNHRVIFAIANGLALVEVPDLIDHKNGDGTDNRPKNLRPATNAQNLWNMKCKSPTGFKGVTYHRRDNLWKAEIRKNGKRFFIGFFKTPELASAAYAGAAKVLHGEFYRPTAVVSHDREVAL